MPIERSRDVDSPDSAPPGPELDKERADYLPEPVRLIDVDHATGERRRLVTAQCVARWASRYRASPLSHPEVVRQGPVPDDPVLRGQLIAELFAWADELGRSHPPGRFRSDWRCGFSPGTCYSLVCERPSPTACF
jgi:hypothetical protein